MHEYMYAYRHKDRDCAHGRQFQVSALMVCEAVEQLGGSAEVGRATHDHRFRVSLYKNLFSNLKQEMASIDLALPDLCVSSFAQGREGRRVPSHSPSPHLQRGDFKESLLLTAFGF